MQSKEKVSLFLAMSPVRGSVHRLARMTELFCILVEVM